MLNRSTNLPKKDWKDLTSDRHLIHVADYSLILQQDGFSPGILFRFSLASRSSDFDLLLSKTNGKKSTPLVPYRAAAPWRGHHHSFIPARLIRRPEGSRVVVFVRPDFPPQPDRGSSVLPFLIGCTRHRSIMAEPQRRVYCILPQLQN